MKLAVRFDEPAALERHRGAIVWRTMMQVERHRLYLLDRQRMGHQVHLRTRRGERRHICTVVAVWRPDHESRAGDWEWASALSRVTHENSPRGHRFGSGRLLLRIDATTAPNMLGRYIERSLP